MDLMFLPEGVAPWAAAVVVVASYFTAALTAALGLGGGLALLAVMSTVFPAAAVVPVHGVVQLGSNLGRFVLQRRWVSWEIMGWFAGGSIVGAFAGGQVVVSLPAWALQIAVGCFIIYTLWGPMPKKVSLPRPAYTALGLVGSFLTMFFGATGPIVATALSGEPFERMRITATHAACMTLQHGMKALVFGALGFAFAPWIPLLATILVSGFAGTFTGTRILLRLPEAQFRAAFRALLTGLAAWLLIEAALGLRTG